MTSNAATRHALRDYDLELDIHQRFALKSDDPDLEEQFVCSFGFSLLRPGLDGEAPPELAGTGGGMIVLGERAQYSGVDLGEVCDAANADLWNVYAHLRAAGIDTDSANLLWLSDVDLARGHATRRVRGAIFQEFLGSVAGVPVRFLAIPFEALGLKPGRDQPPGWHAQLPAGCHVFLDADLVVWDANLAEPIRVWLSTSDESDDADTRVPMRLSPELEGLARRFASRLRDAH